MEIVFSDDDLARVRVWPRLDLIAEMMYASRPWHAPHRLAALGSWAKRTMTGLGPLGAPVLQDVRSNAFQLITGTCTDWHGGLALGTFSGEPDLDDLVDTVVSAPAHWQSVFDHHRGRVGTPINPGVSAGADARIAIGESLRQFHRVALRPYWDQLNAMTAVVAAAWMSTLATRGVEALFNELNPFVRWHQPTLSVDVAGPEVCHPRCFAHHMTDHEDAVIERVPVSGRGLTILPTVFKPGCGIWGDFGSVWGYSIYCLTVPVPVTWEWFETCLPGGGSDALGDLLGLTRSWVLQACVDDSPSTSKLARTVGISISSASEHAAVLRAAGLLRSERRGNSVLHRTTQVGQALIQSTRTPDSSNRRPISAAKSTINPPAPADNEVRSRV